jgi:hypothetical protein
MNYNLLEEPWIPVLMRDGRYGRVGIKDAFTQAGRIRQIAASNPMDRVAVLRFLLALLYWCRGSPPDEGSPTSAGSFPPDWFKKLDEHKDCFNLLGEGKRFYQVRKARRQRPATDLLQEIPTGNNFWHFRHSTDGKDGLCAPCCALGLLRLPLFSASGLPDLKSGINGTPPVYVIPWGMSLLATLRANWGPHKELGMPAWAKPDIRPTPHQDVPLLTGLTLLSRRVWLHDPSAPGLCIGCGARGEALIRECEFETAGKQENDRWNDPHVLYSDDKPRKAERAPDLTAAGKFRMDRPWPSLLARVLETCKIRLRDSPSPLFAIGFSTHQAKNIDVWERVFSVPPTPSIAEDSAALTREWQRKMRGLEERIVRSKVQATGRPAERKRPSRRHPEIRSAVASIRPHVEGRVSANLGELLTGGDPAWEEAAREYRPMMETIAGSLSPGFTTAAVQWRNQIANALPDMRPKTESAKKRGRRNGEDK